LNNKGTKQQTLKSRKQKVEMNFWYVLPVSAAKGRKKRNNLFQFFGIDFPI
jgi:hypothetical protein